MSVRRAGDSGRARRVVCHDHSWTCDAEGQLIGAPHIGKRAVFDKRSCCLPAFKCEIWQGFVFVALVQDAEPLRPRLAALDAIIWTFHPELMKSRYGAHEIWHTNWKSLVENFMEGCHLSPLHRDTLHPVSPTGLCQHFPAGDAHFSFFAGFSPDMERSKIGHGNLTDAHQAEAHVPARFIAVRFSIALPGS